MERYHVTYCQGPLEITGLVTVSGPQEVGVAGVPDYVAELFRNDYYLNCVSIERKNNSVIYRRMKPHYPPVSQDYTIKDEQDDN